jgi:chromate transport protein ChrA
VSPPDFLLGLTVIQAFPGPNFNSTVYLRSLAVAGRSVPSYLGALIAFDAMYAPGLFIFVGFTGLWRISRAKAWFLAILRGVNAAAVGLVFTAVYKC